MVQSPVKVQADANLVDAIHLILVNKISGLCVVDENNTLIGVLSETDCLRGVLSATYNDSGIGTVGEFMTSQNLHTASPTDQIIDVAADMLEKKIRRRPVISNDGKLVGQITIRQILRAVKEFSSPVDRTERD
ncbi:MAG: CBS domain-containing protein [Gammaproteobacteria bacterium]|nr:CBS domain-containing protein [Gammaproteobacteria bacterium]MBK6583103.1 CBS domain-containing protein [Gammaproteobacteria bacterium]MBK7168014.1 CBS domain-containing protein [Gammaproteobacteria bacterium]MBK7519232.1 CBS domain-containing protein [Gammaproteobacteria bacterium]MBK7730028.1 CBS domain-containing protein [Gammaproteobacteria bacterium]